MRDAAAIALVLLSLLANVHAADVYRWTDENGRVHYGDEVPDAMKQQAKPVDVSGGRVSETDRTAAKGWLARVKAGVESLRRQLGEAQAPKAAAITGPKPAAQPVQLTCAQEWERFERSGSCFDPYRTKNGQRGEAFEHCTSMPMPSCINPKQPSSERAHATTGTPER